MTYDTTLDEFRELEKGWDSYEGLPITDAALKTASALRPVPCSDGGVQVELHAGGMDIEIEIGPDGTVQDVFWERS